LGVLTYELAYGRVPFPIWSQSDMVKIVKDPVYFPTWTSISDKMQHLIKSMLNKDPTKRLSINEIMASSLISEYVGKGCGLKSEIDALF
jgi:serine/threonine protein kinase